MSSAREKLLKQFRELVGVRLERINRRIVELEAGASLEAGRTVLRELHGLKGEARMMGFDAINAVVHEMEELVRSTERADHALSAGSIDALLQAGDAVLVLSGAAVHEPPQPPPEVDKLVRWLKECTRLEQSGLAGAGQGSAAPSSRAAPPPRLPLAPSRWSASRRTSLRPGARRRSTSRRRPWCRVRRPARATCPARRSPDAGGRPDGRGRARAPRGLGGRHGHRRRDWPDAARGDRVSRPGHGLLPRGPPGGSRGWLGAHRRGEPGSVDERGDQPHPGVAPPRAGHHPAVGSGARAESAGARRGGPGPGGRGAGRAAGPRQGAGGHPPPRGEAAGQRGAEGPGLRGRRGAAPAHAAPVGALRALPTHGARPRARAGQGSGVEGGGRGHARRPGRGGGAEGSAAAPGAQRPGPWPGITRGPGGRGQASPGPVVAGRRARWQPARASGGG